MKNLLSNFCLKIIIPSSWNDLLYIGDEKQGKKAGEIRWGEFPTKSVRKNRAVGVCQNFWQLTVDRAGRPPTVIFLTVGGKWSADSVDRSSALERNSNGRPTRSTKINREHWHCARSTGAVGRRAHMHSRARRSTGSDDRTLSDLFIQSLQKGKDVLVQTFCLRIWKQYSRSYKNLEFDHRSTPKHVRSLFGKNPFW